MFSKVKSAVVSGIDGILLDVEVDISYGLPAFNIVGLPQTAVRESKERVKAALVNCGYPFPMDRVTINLAPADIKKQGTGLDLPLAMGILIAQGIIGPEVAHGFLFLGELSLDGAIKRVNGVLSVALSARQHGLAGIFVPVENRLEASAVGGMDVFAVGHLNEVVRYFTGHQQLTPARYDPATENGGHPVSGGVDFSDVRGQQTAKQALEVAAAGHHNLLMIGPPGSGKSMMAKRLPSIMPPLSFEESLAVTRLYSVQGLTSEQQPLVRQRPFRAPHHTISDAGLVGGGPGAEPGEISLAHLGVLFLDELPEFKKNVLEMLRQPLEDGQIRIVRSGIHADYPCRFMLVAAMNPCPCGFFTDDHQVCTCTVPQIKKYRGRISGPLADRIDIHMEVPRIPYQELNRCDTGESSGCIRDRVETAKGIQAGRFASAPIFCNAQMTPPMIRDFCHPDAQGRTLLARASEAMGLSARAIHSLLKVARTIADLEKNDRIRSGHIAQAVQYRNLDRRIIP